MRNEKINQEDELADGLYTIASIPTDAINRGYLYIGHEGKAYLIHCKDLGKYVVGEKVYVRIDSVDYWPDKDGEKNKRVLADGSAVSGRVKGEIDNEIKAPQGLLVKMRRWTNDQIESRFNPRHEGLVKTLITGSKAFLTKEEHGAFKEAGLAHVLAISGLHMAIFYGVVENFLSLVLHRRRLRVLLSLAVCWGFGIFAGLGPSILRSLLWLSLPFALEMIKKPYFKDEGMLLILIIMLIYQPFWIYHVGFLLSVTAAFAISFMAPRVMSLLGVKEKEFIRPYLISYLSVTAVIAPIQILFFHELSLWGILFNAILVPIYGVLMISMVLAVLLPLGAHFFFYKLASWILDGQFWILDNLSLSGKLIISHAYMGKHEVILYYFSLLIIFWGRYLEGTKRIWKLTIIYFGASFLLSLVLSYKSVEVIHFLDVGQGDCTIIQKGHRACFIDTGGLYGKDIYGETIGPYLWQEGIRDVEVVFITHWDYDHYGALERLNHRFSPEILTPGGHLIPESIVEQKVENTEVYRGDEAFWRGVGFEVEFPSYPNKLQGNEGSLVLLMTWDDMVVLFTGDLEFQGMEAYLAYKDEHEVTILHVPHHGSEYSRSDELYALNTPKYAIISCGKNNPYGHPHRSVIDQLNSFGTSVLRTDQLGSIKFSCVNGNWEHVSPRVHSIALINYVGLLLYGIILYRVFRKCELLEEYYGLYHIQQKN